MKALGKPVETGIGVVKTATMPDGSPVGLSIDEPKPISSTTTIPPTAQTIATEQKPTVKNIETTPSKALISYESDKK